MSAQAGPALPQFLWPIVAQLRRRGVRLGIDDCFALRQALAAGFGWSSTTALRELCVALWAKSAQEADVVRGVFNGVGPPQWDAGAQGPPLGGPTTANTGTLGERSGEARQGTPVHRPVPVRAKGAQPPPASGRSDNSLVLVPQYPLTERDIAQAWRRLRRPQRHGPRTEVDVSATIRRRADCGVVTPPVLVPPRRNTARVVLLLDRQGSMAPYHGLVDHARRAIEHAGRLEAITVAYFHDVPGSLTDRSALHTVKDPFDPRLDEVLPLVPPLHEGRVYDDPALTKSRDLAGLLGALGPNTAVTVISDAGAARGWLDSVRLLDTIALLKALGRRAGAVAWLNPVPAERWPRTTAEQVARHVAMFPWTREGFHAAVSVLKQRPANVERPV